MAHAYDELCERVRSETESECAIVIVINGNKGSGCSLKTKDPSRLVDLASMLEDMANDIRNDLKVKNG